MPEIMVTAVFLVWTAIWDIRRGRIPMNLLLLWILVGFIMRCYLEGIVICLVGMLPGIFLCVYSKVTGEQRLGLADAMAMLGFAGTAGAWVAYESLMMAFFFVFPIAVYWLIIKGKPKTVVPFLPFVGGGYVCVTFFIRSLRAVIP